MAEEMLDAPLACNEVPDLMMKAEDGRMIPEAATKQRREEVARVARGRRKRQREVEIRPEKHKHSSTDSRRTHNPAGFYSEEWDDTQQKGGRCSTQECVGDQKGGPDKRSIKYRPPAI